MVLGFTPALKMRIFGGLRRLATASAIWLKQALSWHRKRMFLSRIALLITPSTLLSGAVDFCSLNTEIDIKYFLHQFPFFVGPLGMVFQGDRAGAGNDQAARFAHGAVESLDPLIVFVVQRVRHPENGTQLANDLLIARRQLTKGQMLLARVSLAVVPGDVSDQIQIQFAE